VLDHGYSHSQRRVEQPNLVSPEAKEMHKSIRILITAFAGAAILVALGFSSCRTNPDAENIRIGVINPLTGAFGTYGEPIRDGITMAVDEINSKGGINGRKIELVSEDDGGDPKTSVNAFTKLATVSKVPVVIGPLSSGTSMATAPLSDRYKVVQLSTLAGTIDLTHAGDYVFRVYPSSELGSRFIANVAVDRFKTKRAAILYANNAVGVASRRFVTEVLQQSGVSVVDVETFNDGDRDFRTQLTKIRDAKPDLVIASAYYEEGAQILVQAKQLGITVPFLGEDNWFGPIANIIGDQRKNLYFADIAFGENYNNDQPMQQFIAAFKQRYNRVPNSYSACGYTAVYLIRQAIESGGYDGTKIKDALYKTDMDTAFGHVKYDENGDNVGAKYALYQLSESNERVPVQ
jgi:branched-chain amino acid transport system substrate-binding protein